MKILPAYLTALMASAALSLVAHAQDGDNRDDHKSGKTDRKGDGNSGHGDDLHRKPPPDRKDHGGCPFHAKDRDRPPEKDRPPRPEGKKEGDRPEPSPEQRRCMEALRRAIQELRERHESGDLSCDEVRERLARLKERLRENCGCGQHKSGDRDPTPGPCPFHPKEKGERPPKPEGKERGDRPPRPEPEPEHKRCLEAFRRAMQELREAHDNGDLTCDEARERIASLKQRLENCGCGHHGGRKDKGQPPRGQGGDKDTPPHRDH